MMDEKTRKIIENNPVALATINQEGKPHVIAFVKIKDDKIIVINNYMVNTTSNIKKTNVSLAVWNKKLGGYQIKKIKMSLVIAAVVKINKIKRLA